MTRAEKRIAIMLLLMSSCFFPPGEGAFRAYSPVRPALAEEGWKAEFEDLCGRTDDSMSLSKDELKTLLSRCDKLKPAIEAQEETARKVYLKRLRMCRDLLAYVYEVKSRK